MATSAIAARAPGGNDRVNIAVILVLSALATAFFLCTSPSYFAGGAGSFLEYADAIVSGKPAPAIVQRDIGYPLLLVLTGFPLTGSLIGVIAAQALMGLLMPLLVYWALPGYPRIAFLMALICIISLVPYQFIKMIYHDQLYVFLTLLLALLFVRFVQSGRRSLLYAMTVVATAVSFTRPAGNVVFIVLIGCALIVRRERWVDYLIATLVFAAIVFAGYEYRRFTLGLAPGEPMPSYTGTQFFYNIYLNADELGVKLSPQLGPAMQKLADDIREQYPDPANAPALAAYRDLAPEVFEAAMNFHDPDAFVRRVFEHPQSEYYFNFISLPTTINSDLFTRASWEVVRANPLYPIRYTLRNLASYFFLPGYYYPRMSDSTRLTRSGPQYYPQVGGVAVEPGLTARAERELSYVPLEADFAFLKHASDVVRRQFEQKYNSLNRVLTGFLLLGLALTGAIGLARWRPSPFLSRWFGSPQLTPLAGAFLGVFAIVFYNALITSAFVDPNHRYQYMTLPLVIICGGLGLCALYVIVSRARRAAA